MKLIATRKSDQNRTPVDPWTTVHFSTGLAFGLMAVPLRYAFAAAVAYELAEQALERRPWGQTLFVASGPEILSNAVVDTVVFAVGHGLGKRWNAS